MHSMHDHLPWRDNCIVHLWRRETNEKRRKRFIEKTRVGSRVYLRLRWETRSSYWWSYARWSECTSRDRTCVVRRAKKCRHIEGTLWIRAECVASHRLLCNIDVQCCWPCIVPLLRVIGVWQAIANDFFSNRAFLFGTWSDEGMAKLKITAFQMSGASTEVIRTSSSSSSSNDIYVTLSRQLEFWNWIVIG